MENFKTGHLGKKHINCFVRKVGIRKKIKTIKKSLNFLQRIRTTDIRILNFNDTLLNYRERYVLAQIYEGFLI